MGSNYNIHTPNEDSYYYCPNADCPCHETVTTEDNYRYYDLIFGSYDKCD